MNKFLKSALVSTILCALSLGAPLSASAAGEAIAVGATSAAVGSAGNSLGVSLTGFDASSSYIAVVSASDGLLSLGTTSGVTALVGYAALDVASESFGFEGDFADVQAALASLTFDAPSSAGDVTIDLTVTESASGSSTVFFNPSNGHYYEYVAVGAGDISWGDANAEASGMSLLGMTGYLVTITDTAENDFIANKTSAINAWIGAARSNANDDGTYDDVFDTTDPAGLIWEWKTGPEAGTDFYQQTAWDIGGGAAMGGAFESWESITDTEPNNYQYEENPGWHEGFAVTNWNGSRGRWNDLPNSPLGEDVVPGYLVEYGGLGTSVASEASQMATIAVSNDAAIALPLTGLSAERLLAVGMFATGLIALSFASFGGRQRLRQLAIDNRLNGVLMRLDATLTRMEKRLTRARKRR